MLSIQTSAALPGAQAADGAIGEPTKIILLPPVADGARGGVLLNMGEVFGSEDYPIEALKNEEQGTVAASVTVDQAGRPTACRISTSSRSPSLDSTSCALLMQRGRFRISPDAPAGAVSHVAPVRVRWILPKYRGAPFADYVVRTVFAIDQDVKLGSCLVEGMIDPAQGSDQCAFVRPIAQSIVEYGFTGVPAANRDLVMEQGLLVGTSDNAHAIGNGPEKRLLRRTAWSMAIDADGKVMECTPIDLDEADYAASAKQNMCEKNRAIPFEPLPAGQADRSPRYAVLYYVTYLRPRSGASPHVR